MVAGPRSGLSSSASIRLLPVLLASRKGLQFPSKSPELVPNCLRTRSNSWGTSGNVEHEKGVLTEARFGRYDRNTKTLSYDISWVAGAHGLLYGSNPKLHPPLSPVGSITYSALKQYPGQIARCLSPLSALFFGTNAPEYLSVPFKCDYQILEIIFSSSLDEARTHQAAREGRIQNGGRV